MSPEIVTSKTDNIAIIILVVVVFALGGLLVYFIKKSVLNQEKERKHSQEANEETKNLLLSQIDRLNTDLLRRESDVIQRETENREDRLRHEQIQKESQEAFTTAMNNVAEQIKDLSCNVENVQKDIQDLKDNK